MKKEVEWPRGSGRVAEYTDAERELMTDLIVQYERGEITVEELQRQVDVLHDLKVDLDAHLVETPKEKEPEPVPVQSELFPIPEEIAQELGLTGKYHGKGATDTERASGVEVEIEDMGPLKPGGAGHSVLRVYGSGDRLTAYDASMRACGDYHARRRESTRLLTRCFLEKSGTLPNQAPGGREHVDAYRITDAGREELKRLDGGEEAAQERS